MLFGLHNTCDNVAVVCVTWKTTFHLLYSYCLLIALVCNPVNQDFYIYHWTLFIFFWTILKCILKKYIIYFIYPWMFTSQIIHISFLHWVSALPYTVHTRSKWMRLHHLCYWQPLADGSDVFITAPVGGGESIHLTARDLTKNNLLHRNPEAWGIMKKQSNRLAQACSSAKTHKWRSMNVDTFCKCGITISYKYILYGIL